MIAGIRHPAALRDDRRQVAKEAEYSLYGKRSFDLFGAFDAPLASAAGTAIASFADRVKGAFVSEGVTEATLRDEITKVLSGYSLHDKDQFVLTDHEAFLERFKTTLDRMSASARHHASASESSIAARAKSKAAEIVELAREIAGRELVEAERSIQDLRQRIKDIATAVDELSRDAPSAKALYKARVQTAADAVERARAFQRDHLAGIGGE